LPLSFGLGAACPIDVRARAIVVAIEEQDTRPEVDGGFELAGEVVIQPGDEQVLDSRVLAGGAWRGGLGRRGRLRIGHG
jgi:hypothetical protein